MNTKFLLRDVLFLRWFGINKIGIGTEIITIRQEYEAGREGNAYACVFGYGMDLGQ